MDGPFSCWDKRRQHISSVWRGKMCIRCKPEWSPKPFLCIAGGKKKKKRDYRWKMLFKSYSANKTGIMEPMRISGFAEISWEVIHFPAGKQGNKDNGDSTAVWPGWLHAAGSGPQSSARAVTVQGLARVCMAPPARVLREKPAPLHSDFMVHVYTDQKGIWQGRWIKNKAK